MGTTTAEPQRFNGLGGDANVCDLTRRWSYTMTHNAFPLLGFAHDGFPVTRRYGFANADGTGGVVRIRSGYQLRNITERSTHADGTVVTPELLSIPPIRSATSAGL
jgi:hypothetical protein